MTIHSYIADAAQLKGFRDGTNQAWIPIDDKDFLRFVEVNARLIHRQERTWRAYKSDMWWLNVECPYAEGDVLTIPKTPLTDFQVECSKKENWEFVYRPAKIYDYPDQHISTTVGHGHYWNPQCIGAMTEGFEVFLCTITSVEAEMHEDQWHWKLGLSP